MPMPRTRVLSLVLVLLTVLLIALLLPLIGNIDRIQFLPGRPTSFHVTTSAGGPPPVSPGWSMVTFLMRVLLILALAAVAIGFIANRRIRIALIVIALILGGALMLVDYVGCEHRTPEEDVTTDQEGRLEPPAEADLGLEPSTREVTASNGLYVALAIALSVIVVAVGATLLARWLRHRPVATEDGYQEILDSISDAAIRLRAGEDPYTVVLYCYQEMIRILSKVGGIDATYLTPREFEDRLRSVGLSGQPVHQLTGIFEIVRYGGRVDDTFAARALACLETLQEAHHDDES